MNALSVFELENLSNWLQEEMEGAQLQNIWTNGQQLVLQFYKFKEQFLIVDMDAQRPLLIYLDEAPPVEKQSKPLAIFLNSHAKNLRWKHCFVELSKGRVLDLDLAGGERHCHLQFQLIPKAFNILAEASGKKISWNRPRELPPSHILSDGQDVSTDWREFGQQWLQYKFQKKTAGVASAKSDPRLKALEKKTKALRAIEEQLQTDSSQKWKELGESLKVSDQVADQYKDLYDFKKSRTWNLENAFAQAKIQQKKRTGTLERFEKLKSEIAEINKNLSEQPRPVVSAPAKSTASKILEKSETKGRKMSLDGGFEAVVGKSAQDNLAILRKAQPWDLWLHLKDYPGAHAIILRPRNKEVSSSVVQKVSEWLIRESLAHQKIQWGAKYDVVVVECRHVRPIKGDKLGRVTYHHPQVYSFASKI